MEPRNLIWIQGIAITAAAAIGIGMAVWYQGRPAPPEVNIPAVAPKRKVIVPPAQAYIIPSVLPSKNASGKTASAAPDGSDDPVPSENPANLLQKDAVDPIIHSQPVASNAPVGPYGANAPAPTSPSPYGVPSDGTERTVPSPYGTPSDAPAPASDGSAYPSSSPTVSPLGGPNYSGGGSTTPNAPGITPPATAPGTGPVDTGVPSIPSTPTGSVTGGTSPGV
jgi:hypothetical protein